MNPFDIAVGVLHQISPDKTALSIEAYNKLQTSLEGILWALEHRDETIDRFVGDTDPDHTTTLISDGDEHSGVDFTEGLLRSINGNEFYVFSAEGYTAIKKYCKTNRPVTGDQFPRARTITHARNLAANVTVMSAAEARVINSGLTLKGMFFQSSDATYRSLDVRGLQDTGATTTFDGLNYRLTLSSGDLYAKYINVGDYVWIPTDANNPLTRIIEIVSSTQVKISAQVTLAAGTVTAYVLKGPITFEDCVFDATVWVNNTFRCSFRNCIFRWNPGQSRYGGLLALGSSNPGTDPGRCLGLTVENCLFFQEPLTFGATRIGGLGFVAMATLDNLWEPQFNGNTWIRMAAGAGGTGVFVANGSGSSTFAGEGGVFAGNQEHNPVSTYSTANRQTHLSGVFKVYDDLNMHGAALL